MGSPAGHELMLAHFLVTGLLFFGGILAQDPWPRTVSHPGRMLELFIPMPFHAFFGVAIMMADALLVFAVVFFAWAGSEDRKGRQLDRVVERTHDDAELAAYNARLRALAATD